MSSLKEALSDVGVGVIQDGLSASGYLYKAACVFGIPENHWAQRAHRAARVGVLVFISSAVLIALAVSTTVFIAIEGARVEPINTMSVVHHLLWGGLLCFAAALACGIVSFYTARLAVVEEAWELPEKLAGEWPEVIRELLKRINSLTSKHREFVYRLYYLDPWWNKRTIIAMIYVVGEGSEVCFVAKWWNDALGQCPWGENPELG